MNGVKNVSLDTNIDLRIKTKEEMEEEKYVLTLLGQRQRGGTKRHKIYFIT
jgi:hypothetical protein